MSLYTDYRDWVKDAEAHGIPQEYTMAQAFATRLRTVLMNHESEDEAMFFYDMLYAQRNEPVVVIPSMMVEHLKEFLHGDL